MTETEAFLVRVCRQKLDLDTLDGQSDLRRLGADSLFLIELAVEIEDQFDIYVPAEAVEGDTRIFRIAEWIEAARGVRERELHRCIAPSHDSLDRPTAP